MLGSRVRMNVFYSLIGGFIVPSVLLLAFTPLLVHEMGAADYGLWTISLAGLGLMSALELGLGTAIAKYVAEYTSRDDIRALSATVTIAFTTYVAIGLVLTIPLFLEAHWLAALLKTGQVPVSRVEHTVRLVALGLLPLLLLSGSQSVAVGLQRFEIPMMISIVQNGLTVLAAVGVSYLGGSVEDVVLSSVCALWAVALASMVIGARLLSRIAARPLFATGYTKKTLSYVMYTGLSNVGSLIFGSVDRIAVGAVLGLRAVTYYAVSIGVANRLLILAGLVTRPLLPAASSWLAVGKPDIVRGYLRRATIAVAFTSLGVAGLMLLLSGPFMRLWMGKDFADHSLTTLRVLVIVYSIFVVAAPGYQIANGIGLARVCALFAIVGGAATIGLIVLLGTTIGLVGAGWANAAYCVNLAIPLYVGVVLRRESGSVHGKPRLPGDAVSGLDEPVGLEGRREG